MSRGRIVVSTNSWHNRVYRYWRSKATTPPETVNLCHYMRAVLIYVPFMWLTRILVGFWVIVGAIALSPILVPGWILYRKWPRFRGWCQRIVEVPSHWIPIAMLVVLTVILLGIAVNLSLEVWWKGLAFLGGVVGVLRLVVGAIVGGILLHERKQNKDREASGEEATSGVLSLGWSWIKAKKERICPLIETVE